MKDFKMGALDALKPLFQNYFRVCMYVCLSLKKKRFPDMENGNAFEEA